MTGKSNPPRSCKGSTPNKKDNAGKSPSPKKSKDVSSSAQSSSEHDLSWEANTSSNGNVTLNLEIPNVLWDQEIPSDNESAVSLEIVEDQRTPLSGARSRKRLRSEVSAKDNDILDGMEEEIERQLEAKAERNKLSVLNVKNILRQVITHPHVLAMVKRSARDGNCTISGDNEESPYEPKLTRAKAKELLEKVKDVDWPVTPCKAPVVSEFEALAMQELAEDSDDEEYHPGDETSDNEFSEKDNSELDTPIDQSPASFEYHVNSSLPCTPDSTADRSVTTWSEDGIFKIPLTPVEQVKDGPPTQEEVIARRTRSKLSLSDTPLEEIEKSFVPPDVPPGYYESNINDITGDNDDWHNFLKEFMEPLPPSDQQATEVNDDDEADPEYNVLAEEEVVDKEELRMDRAVKVSRREVNALLAELFEYTENMSSEEDDAERDVTISNIIYSSSQHSAIDSTVTSSVAEVQVDDNRNPNNTYSEEPNESLDGNISKTRADIDHRNNKEIYDDTSGGTSDKSPCVFSLPQRLLLDQQICQHVQLLTQHYLLTYDHPVYEKSAQEVMNFLEDIREKAKDKHPLSPYRAANLPAAFEVIQEWKHIMESEKGDGIREFMSRQIEQWHLSMLKRVARFPGKLPPELMELMSKSVAFMCPQLLPEVPFKCKLTKVISYVPSEIMLISLGLEEFTEFVLSNTESVSRYSHQQALQYVSHYLVPTKDSDQLLCCIRKEKKKEDSPIKYYYEHNRAPSTVHLIYPGALVPPNQQPSYLLPQNWRDYLYPASVQI